MTDDLVKRLRDFDPHNMHEWEAVDLAADRIEQLERERVLDAKLLADTQALLDTALEAVIDAKLVAEAKLAEVEATEDVGILRARVDELQRLNADLTRQVQMQPRRPQDAAPATDAVDALVECRPIETAPKDGSWVLLWGGSACDGDECFSRSWTDPIRQAKQDADIAAVNSRPVVARWEEENENYRGGAWAYAAWDSAWRSFYEEPTHWMPLPAVDVQNDAYAQRDLMIRANGLLEREIEKLTALLREARQDLEVYITNEYPKDQHPYYERQWNRDMELCRRIDAALEEVKDDPAA